jgi:hypothetical protein
MIAHWVLTRTVVRKTLGFALVVCFRYAERPISSVSEVRDDVRQPVQADQLEQLDLALDQLALNDDRNFDRFADALCGTEAEQLLDPSTSAHVSFERPSLP